MNIEVQVQQLSVVTEIRPCSTLHILGFASSDHQRFLRPVSEYPFFSLCAIKFCKHQKLWDYCKNMEGKNGKH